MINQLSPSFFLCTYLMTLKLVPYLYFRCHISSWSILGLGGIFYPCKPIQFWLTLCAHKILFKTFQTFSQAFVIEHCIRLPFGRGIFRISSTIKNSYRIYITKDLWYPMPDPSGINLAARHSMYCVAQILSIWFLPLKGIACPFCDIISLYKSHINNWYRNLAIFTLLRYLLVSIIRMIILYFCFRFLIYCTDTYLNNIPGHIVPLLLYDNFFVDNI